MGTSTKLTLVGMALLVLNVGWICVNGVEAFSVNHISSGTRVGVNGRSCRSVQQGQHRLTPSKQWVVTTPQPTFHLQMSSLGEEDPQNDYIRALLEEGKKKFKLPPFPENSLVLGGDVAALFLYSFLDHFMNFLFTSALSAGGRMSGLVGLVNRAAEAVGDVPPEGSLPMNAAWIDALHMPAAFISQQLPVKMSYAPLLESAGVSSVLFTSFWIISGYFNEAFSYKNTILCDTTRAITVAGRTWVFAAAAMVLTAYLSDAHAMPLQYQVGGLTQADADYIFDSIIVVVSWRFLVAYLLGRW